MFLYPGAGGHVARSCHVLCIGLDNDRGLEEFWLSRGETDDCWDLGPRERRRLSGGFCAKLLQIWMSVYEMKVAKMLSPFL